MQLFIPYNNADISISTTPQGDLELTITDNPYLIQALLHQFFEAVSAQEFINTIGTQQFDQLVEFYNSPNFEG